jgi:hypothetical protein
MKIPLALGAVVLGALVTGGPDLRAQGGPSRNPVASTDMMKMRGQMMADRRAADARLDALVMTMNTTRGEARLDAAIAVINELARQKRAMAETMDQMHQHMMPTPGPQEPAGPADPHKH